MSSKALPVMVFAVAAFASASPAAQSIAQPSLDYDYYKVKVQPIFMARSLPVLNLRRFSPRGHPPPLVARPLH